MLTHEHTILVVSNLGSLEIAGGQPDCVFTEVTLINEKKTIYTRKGFTQLNVTIDT